MRRGIKLELGERLAVGYRFHIASKAANRRCDSPATVDCASQPAQDETGMVHERFEINPEIKDGKPVIRGTRVPVELIFRKLGAGMGTEQILADHPRLVLNGIREWHSGGSGLCG
jgi:uncharacterized protein (DUF433 family)